MCNSGVDFFFLNVFYSGGGGGCLIPVAGGRCICLRLNECSYCLLIFLPSSSSVRPLPPWHLQLFTCIPPHSSFSLLSSPTPATVSLPPVSSGGACIPAMGYCFSNLADGGQYLCIVFRYSLLVLTQDPGPGQDTKSTPGKKTNKKNTQAPLRPPPPFPFQPKKNIVSMIIICIISLSCGANEGKEVRWTGPREVKV